MSWIKQTLPEFQLAWLDHNPQTLGENVSALIHDLGQPFLSTGDPRPFADFAEAFLDEIAASPNSDPRVQILLFYHRARSQNDNDGAVMQMRIMAAIKMALHFCFIAAETSPGNPNLLHRLTQASTFVGLAKGFASGVKMSAQDDPLVQMARAGAKGRDNIYQPLRDFARSEVKKRNFLSRRNAALTLKPEVLDLAKVLGVYLSEQQAERTITTWLSGITFAGKRSPSAG